MKKRKNEKEKKNKIELRARLFNLLRKRSNAVSQLADLMADKDAFGMQEKQKDIIDLSEEIQKIQKDLEAKV